MDIAITGIRDLKNESYPIVRKTMEILVRAYPDATFFFGGALGSDTKALIYASKLKAYCCVVIVPFTVDKQPLEAREAIKKYADKICELKLPNTKGAFFERNKLLIKRGKDLVTGFTDGRTEGGTYFTMNEGRAAGRIVISVLV